MGQRASLENGLETRQQIRLPGFRIARVSHLLGKRGAVLEKYAPVMLGLSVSLFSFVMYLRTLAPTVLPYNPHGLFDSMMLQTRAYILGIPNPTGYPTYMMITHLFTYLPIGDPAYRVNLASATFAAAGVFVIFCLCRRLTGYVVPSAAAALLFGLSQDFWSQAVITEVYTLNVLLISLVMLVLLVWREKGGDRYLLLTAFLCGICLTHHLTSGLLIPAGLLFVALVDWRKLIQWRLVLKVVGLFLVGLTPYLYLPIRASMNPPLNEADPSNLKNFVALVTGSRFDKKMLSYGIEGLPGRFDMYVHSLTQQFDPAFVVVSLVGFAYLIFRDRSALAMFGVLYAGWLLFALEYSILDVRVYFIPTYLILCILVSAGFSTIISGIKAALRNAAILPARKTAVVAIIGALMVLSPLSGIPAAYGTVDMHKEYAARNTIDAVAKSAKHGAVILHHNSALVYMKLVEKRRPDIKLVDPLQPGRWTKHTSKWLQASEEFLRRGPVYILFPPGGPTEKKVESFAAAGYRLVPDNTGTFYEVVKK